MAGRYILRWTRHHPSPRRSIFPCSTRILSIRPSARPISSPATGTGLSDGWSWSCWSPGCRLVWALLHHRAFRAAGVEPLLQHFGVHARFLIAVPLLLLAEPLAQNVARRIVSYFLSSGLVLPADRPAFMGIIEGCRAFDSLATRAGRDPGPGLRQRSPGQSRCGPSPRGGFGRAWRRCPRASRVRRVLVPLDLPPALCGARLQLALAASGDRHPARGASRGWICSWFLPTPTGALASASCRRFRLRSPLSSSPRPRSWPRAGGTTSSIIQFRVESLWVPMGLFVVLVLVLFLAPLLVFVPRLVALTASESACLRGAGWTAWSSRRAPLDPGGDGGRSGPPRRAGAWACGRHPHPLRGGGPLASGAHRQAVHCHRGGSGHHPHAAGDRHPGADQGPASEHDQDPHVTESRHRRRPPGWEYSSVRQC